MTSKKQAKKSKSLRFESLDKGDNVYVMCDEWVLVDICTAMIRSLYAISRCKWYEPNKDKKKYDWYLVFTKWHELDFTANMIRLSKELDLYEERMQPIREEIHLFKEKLKWKTTETLKSTKAEKCE